MTDYRDHHATIFVSPEVAGRVEALRREWDPGMARQIAAHVTLAYPREAPTLDLLVERVRAASARIAPFRLRLGEGACFERPESGVYLTVEDIDGGYREMREDVLRPPFRCVEVRRMLRSSILGRPGAPVTSGTRFDTTVKTRSSRRKRQRSPRSMA